METQKQGQEETLESESEWQELKEKLEKLVGERILVTYDFGQSTEIACSVLKEVKADRCKLYGHFEIRFVAIGRITCGDQIIFERRNKKVQKQEMLMH